MSQDLFELLGQKPAAASPGVIQDADALAVTPLAPVPEGDGVFASDGEKAALLREQPYTRKGTMPERMVTRQQFIEDFLARGFTERSEFRRGSVMVTKFVNPTNGEYYILNRTFERAYANRRYEVLFPKKSAAAPVVQPAKQAAAEPQEQAQQRPGAEADIGTAIEEAAERVHEAVLAVTHDVKAAEAAAREVEEAVSSSDVRQGGRGAANRRQRVRGTLEGAVRAAIAKYAGVQKPEDAGEFTRKIDRTGAASWRGSDFRIVPADSAPAQTNPEQPHFAVLVTRAGKRNVAGDRLTLHAAKQLAIDSAMALPVNAEAEAFREEMRSDGTGVFGGIEYAVVVSRTAGISPQTARGDMPHFAVTVRRGEAEPIIEADGLTLVAAKARAIVSAIPPRAGRDRADAARTAQLAEGGAKPEPAAPKKSEPVKPVELKPEERDFSYTPADDYTPRGRKTRIEANLAALRLLKTLEAEGRLASPEEKQVLARYCGWGADKACFDTEKADGIADWRNHQAEMARVYGRDSYHAKREMPEQWVKWEKEYGPTYKELKKVLTDEEWRLAAQSVLNAHYTDEPIAHRLWNVARRIGFQGGAVAEFGCGTGKVIGAMPADLRTGSTIFGVERDSVTARIAKQLFPQSRIEEGALQDIPVRPNSVDLAIGNVPFSDIEPSGQKGKVRFNLHNYFIARSVEALRPGGVAVLITSASTLEANDEQRAALADRAELLGAIRLPNDAFAGNANTEVVTDILVLRKPTPERRVASEGFRASLVTKVAEGHEFVDAAGKVKDTVPLNEYFVRHPEMVLGVHSLKGKMYGRDDGQYTVESLPNMQPIAERLDAAIGTLPEKVPNSSMDRKGRRNPLLEESDATAEQLTASSEDKVGSVVLQDGKLYQVSAERELEQPDWHKADFKLPRGVASVAAADKLVKQWIQVRDTLRKVIGTDLNPMASENESERARRELMAAYQKFTGENGSITESKSLRALLRFEPDFGSVEALETVREVRGEGGKRQRKVEPAAILTTRTLRPSVMPTKADSILDAAMLSLGQHGRIDIDYVCVLIGKDDPEAVKKLLAAEGVAYENPETGEVEPRQRYLSGNVRTKLEAADAAAQTDGRFTLNVDALKAVQPARVPFDQIRWPLGATWIPSELVDEFVRETFGQDRDFHVRYFPRGCVWIVPNFSYSHKLQAWHAEGHEKVIEAESIFNSVLAQDPIRITYTVRDGETTHTYFDEQGTANANERAEAMRRAWHDFVNKREDAKALIEETYNNTFNNVVPVEADGAALTFPGLSTGPGALTPRGHQRNGVMRVLTEQAGVVHYGVGFGKTFVGVLAAYEMKRMGAAQKPMILCDNANYAQFVEATRRAYPQARILNSTDEDMKAENREKFKNRIATGDWEIILMQRSHFERIPVSWQTEAKWLADELSDLRAVKSEMDTVRGESEGGWNRRGNAFARRIAKALESAEERLKDAMEQMKARADRGLTWEELGVDFLVVDECHREKKTGFATRFDIKGIDAKASQRGRGLLMKARHIQERRDGRGVIGMSGTVCTNTMAEYWSAMRLFHPKMLEHYGVPRFDNFKTAFCQAEDALELNEANGRWRIVNRLSKFVNGPAFIQFIRAGMDVKMDSAQVKLNLPKLVGGETELCSVPLTDTAFEKMDRLARLYETYEKTTGREKKDLSWVPIVLMQCGIAASIDPRLVDKDAPDEPGSLVNKAVANIVEIYKATRETKASQCVFLDRYHTMDTSVLAKLEKGGSKSVAIELDDADSLPGIEGEEESVAAAKPEPTEKPEEFNLYRDIKRKLTAKGVPETEILIIHDARNADERKAMFNRVDTGDAAVILGSSDKMGIGANFQHKLYAAHHLDPARNMTPDQMDQRNGRMIRDGNENKEVRNIYYGMEDTVTPAIWGRLQRKAAFIKQGLAAKGVGIEFEDTGEIRLEEMKSALISDKRQMKRAELIAEIKEQKVQREVAESRARSLRSNLANIEGHIRWLEQQLPKVQGRASQFEANVVPPFSKLDAWSFRVENLSPRVRVVPDGADEKTTKAIEKSNQMLDEVKDGLTADHNIVMKQLDKLIDALKVLPLDESALVREFGTVRINGLPIKLTKEQVKLASTGEDSICLVANVCGLADSEKRDSEANPARFGSAEALFKLTQATYEAATLQPRSIARSLEQSHVDREESARLVGELVKHDDSRLTQLQAQLAALEKDMRENPFIRGTSRGKAKAAAAVAQPGAGGAAGKPEMPRIKEPVPAAVGAPAVSRRHARV